jgi:hypothetical protein
VADTASACGANAANSPAASATPTATDNRFPIDGNHSRFLLPVCFLMTFVSLFGFCLCGLFSL